MTQTHHVTSREIGMIRIYLKPADKAPRALSKSRWGAKPLYRALVTQAKADGIMNAVAHHTHYGFSNHGPVRENGAEISDPHLTMCVELIGSKDQLELFCRAQGALLADKVIVYKHLEHWHVGPGELAHEDASPDQLAAEAD
ncbi:DUF190 domain-containing protein [Sphingomonas paeninsulae]